MMRLSRAVGLAAVAVCAAGVATAATVTAGFGGRTVDFETVDTYSENGLNFAVLDGHYDIFDVGFQIDSGDVGISGDSTRTEIEISFDGGLFDLVSFYVTEAPRDSDIMFTSNLGDTYVVPVATVPLPGTTMFESLFPDTFKGVSTITLTGNGSFFAFGNFTIDDRTGLGGEAPSPVPLPATLPLLALALGGLGMARRKR